MKLNRGGLTCEQQQWPASKYNPCLIPKMQVKWIKSKNKNKPFAFVNWALFQCFACRIYIERANKPIYECMLCIQSFMTKTMASLNVRTSYQLRIYLYPKLNYIVKTNKTSRTSFSPKNIAPKVLIHLIYFMLSIRKILLYCSRHKQNLLQTETPATTNAHQENVWPYASEWESKWMCARASNTTDWRNSERCCLWRWNKNNQFNRIRTYVNVSFYVRFIQCTDMILFGDRDKNIYPNSKHYECGISSLQAEIHTTWLVEKLFTGRIIKLKAGADDSARSISENNRYTISYWYNSILFTNNEPGFTFICLLCAQVVGVFLHRLMKMPLKRQST